jgi:serine/threonine protein kinase/Leucine-rich repeat (LRR) protein
MSERTHTEAIFFAALEQATDSLRAAYLDEACAGDERLRRRIERLLDAYPKASDFLERPLALAATVKTLAAENDSTIGIFHSSSMDSLDFLASPERSDSLGRIGHYEVLEIVGRGGMGIVLRAFDEKLQRVVAIKALAPAFAQSGPSRQRFVREAQAAAAVTHDNVIAIHAVEDAGPVPYLVMQFIDGPTLQEKIDRNGRLPLHEIVRIGRQIAAGLAAAHAQGLVHRDVKPANILLENGVERVKITDFGLAHTVDDASLAQSGLIAGTPAFMSPEQASGAHVDSRSDLFSLGSVLYALCTGHAPFQADSTRALLQQVRDELPQNIRELNPDVPEELCRLIERLHAKAPLERPASAQEVADRLAGVSANLSSDTSRLADMSTAPRPPARREEATRRRPLRAAAALVLLLTGLGLGEATGITNVFSTVIRLYSPDGTLVVEIEDPEVSVTIDGTELVILGAGAKEIRLKPGNYTVEARKAGEVVSRELVAITKNGRRIVRISKEAKPLAAAAEWEKHVATLPAAEQVQAVARRLKELNPGFDKHVTPTFKYAQVVGLKFNTDAVEDISPLRALKALERLECTGSSERQGKLADLSPLRGLPLTWLEIADNPVSDLSPLRGMPLTELNCRRTQVEDLSPLDGMKLNGLDVWKAPVSDLGPLRGMPIKVLLCHETNVADLSPLQGMPLTVLTLQHTKVTNLAPLKGMPLTWLDVAAVGGVTDLIPLRDMPLEYLNLGEQPVSDLAPLASSKSLRRLLVDFTSASDLTPLRGLTLNELSIRGIPARDLSPLKELASLKSLRLDYRPDLEDFVRSFTGLEKINDLPAAEFWKHSEDR